MILRASDTKSPELAESIGANMTAINYRLHFSKGILALSAAAFIGIGIAFVVFPEYLLGRVGIDAPHGSPLTDIRAVYGGLDLGIGLFLLYCLIRSEVQLGLVASAMILWCLVGSRLVGVAADGEQNAITFYTVKMLFFNNLPAGADCNLGMIA